jgi:hypothetical protein
MNFFNFRDNLVELIKESRNILFKISVEILDAKNLQVSQFETLEYINFYIKTENKLRASLTIAQTIPFNDAMIRILEDSVKMIKFLFSVISRISVGSNQKKLEIIIDKLIKHTYEISEVNERCQWIYGCLPPMREALYFSIKAVWEMREPETPSKISQLANHVHKKYLANEEWKNNYITKIV